MQDIIYFINHNLLLSISWLAVLFALIALEIRIKVYGPMRLSTTSLVELINQQNAILYDLRPTNEFNKGHISQALNYAFSDINNTNLLLSKINTELKNNNNRPVVLVCKEGIKSSQEAFKLKSGGIKNIGYLQGGMQIWQSESLPTVSS